VYTEYFNSAVDRFGHLRGDDAARGLGTEEFGLRPEGTVTSGGRPVRSQYVVANARLAIAGALKAILPARSVVPGTPAGALALWKVDGPVRLRLSPGPGCA
jgi:hypothetical protein